MTPEEQAAKVGEHCNHTATWTTACRMCIAAALRTAREEEREACADQLETWCVHQSTDRIHCPCLVHNLIRGLIRARAQERGRDG